MAFSLILATIKCLRHELILDLQLLQGTQRLHPHPHPSTILIPGSQVQPHPCYTPPLTLKPPPPPHPLPIEIVIMHISSVVNTNQAAYIHTYIHIYLCTYTYTYTTLHSPPLNHLPAQFSSPLNSHSINLPPPSNKPFSINLRDFRYGHGYRWMEVFLDVESW